MKITKRVNWLKVVLLILTVIEIIALAIVDKEMVKTSIRLWRLCILMIGCIFINVLYIGAKRR